jgi:hypothetical protein
MRSFRLAIVYLATSVSLFAQSSAQLGRAPTADDQRKWNSVVLPDGTGLPNGGGSAVQGEHIYASMCAACHGEKGEGFEPAGPRLVGGVGSLATKTPTRTVGSYWPFSTSIWDYIYRAMPYAPGPGTLSFDDTYSVTAYLLYLNGIIAKDDRLDQLTLPRVKMPNRDGFIQDPRPDVVRQPTKSGK